MLELYAQAQASFEAALAFLPEAGSSPSAGVPGDNVVHFRLATIHYAYAATSEFKDAATLARAMQHYKRSLLLTPTAEVWLRAGICAYRQACLGRKRSLFKCKEPAPEYQSADPSVTETRQRAFKEASKYLTEANLLDVSRPQINSWLAICAVETGNVQVAKQTLRQVLRWSNYLDEHTALELAVVLLRCSDEGRAGPGERKWLVEDGRYAADAILVANNLVAKRDSGEVHYILGLAKILSGSDAEALEELQAAVPWFNHDTPCQDEINAAIRACARRLHGNADAAAGPVTVAAAPPRTAAQLDEFQKRLEDTRAGGTENRVADFANWESGFEVYDHDLPTVLEAAAEGRVVCLSLRAARLGAWGVKEIVARIRESPGCLQEVDVANCAAVGQLGKELMTMYPYKRGVCMEAAGTGLPDEDVVRLRNRNEDSAKTLKRMGAEQERSRLQAEQYRSRQAVLEQLGLEDNDAGPETPPCYYRPGRWAEGLELRARQEYQGFVKDNPLWAVLGNEFDDSHYELTSITAKSGETIDILDQDVFSVLTNKKIDMLKEEGIVTMKARDQPQELDEMGEEEGEYVSPEDREDMVRQRRQNEDADETTMIPVMEREPPPAYAALFGPGNDGLSDMVYTVIESRRLVGFMVYLGVRASPDEVTIAREEREEIEAEEAEREAREARIQAERELEAARRQAEWEAAHKELVAARNDITSRAKAIYEGTRQLPKGVASGQIMAHFAYIFNNCKAVMGTPLQLPLHYGLKMLSDAPRPKPRRGLDLHEALYTGKIELSDAVGVGFEEDALTLTLKGCTSEPLEVAVRRGTIFQHSAWLHKQNLIVAVDYLVSIPANGIAKKSMMAYCMNSTCSCSGGETMELTEFYCDASHVLDSQGLVWDHFESCFKASP